MRDELVRMEITNWTRLRDDLILEYQLDPEDMALIDTLEGETDLLRILGAAAREAEQREAMADACDEIAKTKKARAERLRGGAGGALPTRRRQGEREQHADDRRGDGDPERRP